MAKQDILVLDPTGSSTKTSSGATCEMTEAGHVTADLSKTNEVTKAVMIVGNQSLVARSDVIAAFDHDTDKSAVLKSDGRPAEDGSIASFIQKYNPLKGNQDQEIYAGTLKKMGIVCADESGKPASPVLAPADLQNMALKATMRLVN
jgi:hypothetical protein